MIPGLGRSPRERWARVHGAPKLHHFSSVAQLCVSDSLQLHGLQEARIPCPSPTPELTQTHVNRVGDAIQASHPLLSPSPPSFNLSQIQGLFKWVTSLHQVAKILGVSALASVLPMNIQD